MTYTIRRSGRTLRICDRQPTFWRKFETGNWEAETLALLDRLTDSTVTFLDIGAWVGPTALWAAFAARRVLALEADPAALEQLHGNLKANPALAGRIEVIPRALHAESGTIAMGARRKPGDSMSSTLLVGQPEPGKPVWQAETVTPVELARMIGPEEDLVIKMDIEGGEYALLPAMKPLLRKARAALISFHPELARSAFGWSKVEARRQEAKILADMPDFTKKLVGGSTANGATQEWLLERRSGQSILSR